MLKLFKKLLMKKEKTTKEKLKPCDKFVVITNKIELSLDNRENTTGKITITDINKNSAVPPIRIYTLEEQETIIAEPTNLVIDRFKIKIKQK